MLNNKHACDEERGVDWLTSPFTCTRASGRRRRRGWLPERRGPFTLRTGRSAASPPRLQDVTEPQSPMDRTSESTAALICSGSRGQAVMTSAKTRSLIGVGAQRASDSAPPFLEIGVVGGASGECSSPVSPNSLFCKDLQAPLPQCKSALPGLFSGVLFRSLRSLAAGYGGGFCAAPSKCSSVTCR